MGRPPRDGIASGGFGLSAAISWAKAQSSHGISASISEVSTVPPHQIRKTRRRVAIGADIEATPSASSRLATPWQRPRHR
jgi:hypothetical protein